MHVVQAARTARHPRMAIAWGHNERYMRSSQAKASESFAHLLSARHAADRARHADVI